MSQEPLIGNTPGFDPNASRQHMHQGARGRRFRGLMIGVGLLGVLGLVLIQLWWGGWGQDQAKANVDVRESHASPPDYRQQASLPVFEPPKLPPKMETQAEPATPTTRRLARDGRQKPEGPKSLTWNVSIAGAPPDDWFVDGRRPHLAHGCALRPGASIIPAVLNTTIQSQVVPGQVIATVSENVFDADGVGRLLIPQGTKAVGYYRQGLTFGQERLGIVWTELTYPDGGQLNLADANGFDVAGSMGVGGEVNTKWGQILAVAAIFTVFDAAQRSTVPDNESYSASLSDAAATQFARVGSTVVKHILDGAITIRVPAGTQINISVGKTLQIC